MAVLVKQEFHEPVDTPSRPSTPSSFYGDGTALSQSFTADSSYTASMVRLKITKRNNPGRVFVGIYATSSGLPTGGSLSSGSISGDDVTENPDGELWDFALNPPVSITDETEYAIVLTAPEGNLIPPESPNVIQWQASGGNQYAGTFGMLIDGVWSNENLSALDCYFSVWSDGVFRQVDTPTPTDTDTGISLVPLLEWKIDGTETVEDNDFFFIYLNETGTFTDDDLLVGWRTSLELQILAGLSVGTTYYWQVQAISENGDLLNSAVWSFTARAINPPAPSGGANPNGLNNMITMQRLIAAAKNSIFYEDI